jgi:hypothetical protein
LANDKTVCSGRGICSAPDTCIDCSGGYIGDQCETLTCFGKHVDDPLVCSGRGKCTSANNCVCNILQTAYRVVSPYSGDQCENVQCYEKWSNSTTVCHGFGSCDSYNNCTCNEGYTGLQCQFDSNSWIWDKEGSSNDEHIGRAYFGFVATISFVFGSLWFVFCLLVAVGYLVWRWYVSNRGKESQALIRDQNPWPAATDLDHDEITE